MSKAVTRSLPPQVCERIANGKQTMLVVKQQPKLETPYKEYIYCTKPKKFIKGFANDDLFRHVDGRIECGFSYQLATEEGATPENNILSGRVIGEFVCDKIDKLEWETVLDGSFQGYTYQEKFDVYEIEKATCLTVYELAKYSNCCTFYGLHISDLVIYDKPKELGEFFKPLKYDENEFVICGTPQEMRNIEEWDCETVFNKKYTECTLQDCPILQKMYRLTHPPQSWCYVEEV